MQLVVSIALTPLLVLLISCTSEQDSAPDDVGLGNDTETVTPELPAPVVVDDSPVTPLRDLEITRIEVDSPDWMAFESDSLWVRLDPGTILRVDPRRARVVHTVKAAGHGQFAACSGFGASPGAIWSCSPRGPLQRVDTATNRTVEALSLEMSTLQGHLVVADQRLWAITPDGTSVVPIDLATNQAQEPLPLGLPCSDLAADDPVIWVVCPWDDQVLAVDVTTSEVVHRISLDEPRQVAVGESLWVTFAGGVSQIDLTDLDVIAVYQGEGLPSASFSIGDTAAWFRTDGGPFLVGIDPAAREVFAVVSAEDLPSGGNVMEVDGHLWATAYDDAALVQLEQPAR